MTDFYNANPYQSGTVGRQKVPTQQAVRDSVWGQMQVRPPMAPQNQTQLPMPYASHSDYVMDNIDTVLNPMGDIQPEQLTQDMISSAMSGQSRGPASGEYVDPNAQKALGKDRDNQVKTKQKEQSDYEKKVREYMMKKEELAIDSNNRMQKLDARYKNQGPNMGFLMQMADQEGLGAQLGKKTNFSGAYAGTRLSEKDYNDLRNNLAKQQSGEYSDLDKTARDMYRMGLTKDMADQGRLSRERVAGAKSSGKTSSMSGEMMKRLDNVAGMDTALTQMKELASKGAGGWGDWMRDKNPAASASKFNALVDLASEMYGRMQSGGAIQRDEAKRFVKAMFDPSDSQDIKMFKLEQLRGMIDQRAETLAYGRDFGTLPSSLKTILNNKRNSGGGGKSPSVEKPMTKEQFAKSRGY